MSGTRDLPVQHPAPDDWFSGIGEEGESEWLTEEPQIQNEDWSLPAAGDARGDEERHESGGRIEPTSLSSPAASAARVAYRGRPSAPADRSGRCCPRRDRGAARARCRQRWRRSGHANGVDHVRQRTVAFDCAVLGPGAPGRNHRDDARVATADHRAPREQYPQPWRPRRTRRAAAAGPCHARVRPRDTRRHLRSSHTRRSNRVPGRPRPPARRDRRAEHRTGAKQGAG